MNRIVLIVVVALLTFSSCRYMGGKRIRGNGNITTREISVPSFTSVNQRGSMDVMLISGTSTSVKVEADENLLQYIETTVDNGTLNIRTKDGYWLKSNHDMKVYVTAPHLSNIKSFGSGDIISQSTITNDAPINFEISGSADIKVDVNAPAVSANINGSGDMELKGETKSFSGEVRGSGDIKAANLKTEESTVDIAGSGNADIFASVKIDVTVKGSGDVRYKGNPPSVVSNMKGSGTLEKMN